MRFSYVRLPLLAATAWLGIGFSVWAMDLRYGETVYVSPTTATYSLAPSYLVTSSYVRPSAYVLPTGYVRPSAYIYPTAYSTAYISQPVSLLPTTYVATTWPSAYVATTYRRGLFGRQWVVERPVLASYATTYVPSAYVVPTYYTSSYRVRTYTPTVYEYPAVWETAAVTSRGVDCDEVTWAPPVGSSPSSSSTGLRPITSSTAGQTESKDDPTIPSDVYPPSGESAARRSSAQDAATRAQTPVGGRADSPPLPPTAEKDQNTLKNQTGQPAANAGGGVGGNAGTAKAGTDPAANPKAVTPNATGGDQKELPPVAPAPGADNSDGTTRRDSGKAIYSTPMLRGERRNILIGRVENSGGDPQGEVPVTVTSRSNNLVHHDGLTNAYGGFAIRLTDGEWTVNVTMPSGRVYPVRSITVSNGRVMDNQERREVQNLIISY